MSVNAQLVNQMSQSKQQSQPQPQSQSQPPFLHSLCQHNPNLAQTILAELNKPCFPIKTAACVFNLFSIPDKNASFYNCLAYLITCAELRTRVLRPDETVDMLFLSIANKLHTEIPEVILDLDMLVKKLADVSKIVNVCCPNLSIAVHDIIGTVGTIYEGEELVCPIPDCVIGAGPTAKHLAFDGQSFKLIDTLEGFIDLIWYDLINQIPKDKRLAAIRYLTTVVGEHELNDLLDRVPQIEQEISRKIGELAFFEDEIDSNEADLDAAEKTRNTDPELFDKALEKFRQSIRVRKQLRADLANDEKVLSDLKAQLEKLMK